MIPEKLKITSNWTIEKYASDDDFAAGKISEVVEVKGNLGLNEGLTELLTLLIGGAATAFSNANAYIGVGDSSTAAVASQTGLQAATNKTYKGMFDETFPSVTNQTVSFKATFGSSEGNHSWQEITVANGNSDTAKNLNRKVQDMGTKTSGATWVVTVNVTIG